MKMKNKLIFHSLLIQLGNIQGKWYKMNFANSIVATIKNITNIEKSNDSNLNVMKYQTRNWFYKYKFVENNFIFF